MAPTKKTLFSTDPTLRAADRANGGAMPAWKAAGDMIAGGKISVEKVQANKLSVAKAHGISIAKAPSHWMAACEAMYRRKVRKGAEGNAAAKDRKSE